MIFSFDAKVTCPNCGEFLPDEWHYDKGRSMVCPRCEFIFTFDVDFDVAFSFFNDKGEEIEGKEHDFSKDWLL